MRRKVLFIVTLPSVLLAGRTEAQRCLPKMRGVELKAGLNEADGYVLGATLSSYARGGDKWVCGAKYLRTNHDHKSTTIPTVQLMAEGGYYYNSLSDAEKVVFFYVGVSALAGYETVNWDEKALYDGARLSNGDAFVYGYAATPEVELYLADFIALMASLRGRFPWDSNIGVCHAEYGIDVKFIINWRMPMGIEATKRFPIEDFLARLGRHPVQRYADAV